MKAFIVWLWNWIFGCHHEHISWPITLGNRTYEVCCDCGAEFDYSWEMMAPKHPVTSAAALSPVADVPIQHARRA